MGKVFTASTDDPQMMRSLAWATLALKSPPSDAMSAGTVGHFRAASGRLPRPRTRLPIAVHVPMLNSS